MRAQFMDWQPDEYHLDPCPEPSLSSHIAHKLVSKSPLHAWSAHPRLGGHRKSATKSQDNGTLTHALMLGGREIVEMPYDDYRTKAAKEARDEATAAGKIPVKSRELDYFRHVAERLTGRLRDCGIVLDGVSEQAMVWQEETVHGVIQCRGMMDHVRVIEGQIIDLKTITSADEETCARHAMRYGYHIQETAYRRGFEKAFNEWLGRSDYVIAYCEIEPPYAVYPCRLDGTFRALGAKQWEDACAQWAWCLSRNEWPGYANRIETLNAPGWAMAAAMMDDEEEEAA